MLSAVAARKAKATTGQESISDSISSLAPSPTPGPSTPKPETPKSKPPRTKRCRATSNNRGENFGSDKRKNKRHKKEDRYYVTPLDGSISRDNGDVSISDEDDLEFEVEPIVTRSRSRRAYSPSRPRTELVADIGLDSSDDDVEIPTGYRRATASSRIERKYFAGPLHSVPGSDEVLILLSSNEHLYLLGSYTFRALNGLVNFYGAIIGPVDGEQIVYAPWSSPLPSIYTHASPFKDFEVDKRFTSFVTERNDQTLVLIRPHATNIKNLGEVVRPFRSIYSPLLSSLDGVEAVLDGVWRVEDPPNSSFALLDISPSWEENIFAARTLSTSHLSPSSKSDSDPSNGEDIPEPSSIPIYLVKGPKNSGKSTLGRLLFNRLLSLYTHVAHVDCDIGQTEFLTPGMVGLTVHRCPAFGPPSTHPTLPLPVNGACTFVGATSPKSDPGLYLDAVRAALEVYVADVQYPSAEPEDDDDFSEAHGHIPASKRRRNRITESVPLIINTQGWTKGLGADLLREIEESILPSCLSSSSNSSVQIIDLTTDDYVRQPSGPQPSTQSAQFGRFTSSPYDEPSFNNGGPKTKKISVEPYAKPLESTKLSDRFTAADHRSLTLMSYFYAQFPPTSSDKRSSITSIRAESWISPVPLSTLRPYEVSPRAALHKVILVGNGSEDVVVGEIGRVMRGALVAFVDSSASTSVLDIERTEAGGEVSAIWGWQNVYEQKRPPPDPRESVCLGLGFVRSLSDSLVDGTPGDNTTTASNVESGTLHVLTPLPLSFLSSSSGSGPARTWIKGELEMPIWGWLPPPSESNGKPTEKGEWAWDGDLPFLEFKNKSGALGAEKRRVRRNLMRRGLM